MSALSISRKKEKRVNFLLPEELARRATLAAKTINSSVSELFRTALINYLDGLERKKIELELEKGYKTNQTYYSQMSKEWAFADSE